MNAGFWEGKTIVVTGASSGIGKALVSLLSNVNCKVYALARRVEEIPLSKIGKMIPMQCDFSDPQEVQSVSQQISNLEKTNGIDALFNNAGITAHGKFSDLELDVYRKAMEVNFFAPVAMTKILLPLLIQNKGVVVSTSTVSGLYGVPARAAYSASKSALHGAMEALRIEMRDFGVRSVIVCPPYTRTGLRTSGLDSQGNPLKEAQAEGKILEPEDVAKILLESAEDPNSRLVTLDKSGLFVKLLRLFSPSLLESIMYKKLYKDFH